MKPEYNMDLNPVQQKSVRALERALLHCKNTGVHIYARTNSLYACNSDVHHRVIECGSAEEAMEPGSEIADALIPVETYGVLADSGA